MAVFAGRKEMVAACMESPFYFAMPLRRRLELMHQVEQRFTRCTLRRDFLTWVKTGELSQSEEITPPEPPGA